VNLPTEAGQKYGSGSATADVYAHFYEQLADYVLSHGTQCLQAVVLHVGPSPILAPARVTRPDFMRRHFCGPAGDQRRCGVIAIATPSGVCLSAAIDNTPTAQRCACVERGGMVYAGRESERPESEPKRHVLLSVAYRPRASCPLVISWTWRLIRG